MAKLLEAVGWITIVLGFIAGGILLYYFKKPGMFSPGKLEGVEIAIAIGAVFYHFIPGILCLAVSQLLESRQVSDTNLERADLT